MMETRASSVQRIPTNLKRELKAAFRVRKEPSLVYWLTVQGFKTVASIFLDSLF